MPFCCDKHSETLGGEGLFLLTLPGEFVTEGTLGRNSSRDSRGNNGRKLLTGTLLPYVHQAFLHGSVSLAWGWCCPQQAGSSFHISHHSRQSLTGMAIGQFALGNPSLGPIQMILRCVKLTAEFNYDNRVREILSFP